MISPAKIAIIFDTAKGLAEKITVAGCKVARLQVANVKSEMRDVGERVVGRGNRERK